MNVFGKFKREKKNFYELSCQCYLNKKKKYIENSRVLIQGNIEKKY
jgi:hypothetical protein